MVVEGDTLEHYGVKRRSGRYPWGSGKDPQRSKDLLSIRAEMQAKGMKETDIAKALGMNTAQLRTAVSWANKEEKERIYDTIQSAKKDGLSNAEISRVTGIPESTIRNYQSQKDAVKIKQLDNITNSLKEAVANQDYIDVGVGVERGIGISRQKLKTAVAKLKEEGYYEHEIYVRQVSDPNKWTTVKVLTKEPDIEVVKANREKIAPPGFSTEDGGLTNQGLKPIENVSWDRVKIRYGDEGGVDRDGMIQMRRNVPDLDLGDAHYAQVRISVGGTHYLKGMAMYSDDMPKGVDLVFNTNKPKGTPREKVLKALKDNPDNPFGATIVRQKGALNIVNEEGDWNGWNGSRFPAQFLSKQPMALVKDRLDATYKGLDLEYKELSKLTNPIVKKYLLEEYSKDVDSKARHLKVLGLPRSKGHVLTPFPEMKPNEVYAPNYKDGERVVLIRYPHGGTFEIPELTVNNKGPAKKVLGNSVDAIGIHPSVAHKLSGADFDGDAVYVIPNNNHRIRATSSLAGLKDFDPNQYSVGHKTVTPRRKQTMMGEVSNLITDMTIKGASVSEITRAVRHSMVVIDSEKHQLDWKASERDNGISALRKKYQSRPTIKYNAETKTLEKGRVARGSSTLISRAKSTIDVPDPKTGKVNKTPLMDLVKDAHTLSSGTAVENAYANYINKAKALSNSAKKQANHISPIQRNPAATKLYSKEVLSLDTKLNVALSNAPRERRAQIMANATYSKNVKPDMEPDQKKKLKSQALGAARAKAGAKKTMVTITDKEWEAIQAGAISNNKLLQILNNTNMDDVRKLATPRPKVKMTPAKLSRAKTLLDNGYTYAQVAESLGVSTSTLYEQTKG